MSLIQESENAETILKNVPNISVVIAAGGTGARFGDTIPKQFHQIRNIPLIIRTLKPFYNYQHCAKIVVAVHPQWIEWMEEQIEMNDYRDKVQIVEGGLERGDSVYNGLKSLPETNIALIHDAVRPFIDERIIRDTSRAAMEYGAAAAAIPVTDTLKLENDGFIQETIDRQRLWRVQTPQAFKYDIIMRAYAEAAQNSFQATDDCTLVEKFTATKIKLIMGSEYNIKITTPEDMEIAGYYAAAFR